MAGVAKYHNYRYTYLMFVIFQSDIINVSYSREKLK